jgi:hypothetical protein
MRRIAFSLAAFFFTLGTGCAQEGSTPGYTVLSGDLSAVRVRFNQDKDKVRAIFLASPT